jgi:hypothetical protein
MSRFPIPRLCKNCARHWRSLARGDRAACWRTACVRAHAPIGPREVAASWARS